MHRLKQDRLGFCCFSAGRTWQLQTSPASSTRRAGSGVVGAKLNATVWSWNFLLLAQAVEQTPSSVRTPFSASSFATTLLVKTASPKSRFQTPIFNSRLLSRREHLIPTLYSNQNLHENPRLQKCDAVTAGFYHNSKGNQFRPGRAPGSVCKHFELCFFKDTAFSSFAALDPVSSNYLDPNSRLRPSPA